VQIHPSSSRLLPPLGSGGIGRRSTWNRLLTAALKQAKVDQHWQTVLVAPEQISWIEITMDQLLSVQHSQRWQQLTQKQQHFPRTEHQLPLQTLLLDLQQS